MASYKHFGSILFLGGQDSHVLADDAQHDLVGTTADADEARIAISLADRIVGRKAHAAPVLEAAIGDLSGKSSGFELQHRRHHNQPQQTSPEPTA